MFSFTHVRIKAYQEVLFDTSYLFMCRILRITLDLMVITSLYFGPPVGKGSFTHFISVAEAPAHVDMYARIYVEQAVRASCTGSVGLVFFQGQRHAKLGIALQNIFKIYSNGHSVVTKHAPELNFYWQNC